MRTFFFPCGYLGEFSVAMATCHKLHGAMANYCHDFKVLLSLWDADR